MSKKWNKFLLGLAAVLLVAFAVWAVVIFIKRESTDYRDTTTYIGLTESQAIDRAESGGLPHRVVERDGEQFPITLDLNPDRINFTINSDEVTKAEFY